MKRVRAVACAVLSLAVSVPFPGTASVITDVSPSHAPTLGGVTITIIGADFGAAGNSVTLGGRECAVTAETPGQIECTAPEGSGAFQPLRVFDGSGTSSPPYALPYDAPEITNVSPSSAATRGGSTITINGHNFGASAVAREVKIRDDCVPCDLDGDGLRCTVPPGQGTNVPITMTVDGQRVIPWVAWSYDPPSITGVTPKSVPAAGNTPITIAGTNFGLQASATVGGAPCPIDVQTHDRIECTAPAGTVTGPSAVRVIVAGQASNDGSLLYGGPSSKCDAAKAKISGALSKCLAGNLAKNAKEEQDESDRAAAIAKCEDKFTTACDKAELGTDCSQPGTCGDILRIDQQKLDGILSLIR